MKYLIVLSLVGFMIACGDDSVGTISVDNPSKADPHLVYLFGDSISTDTPITYGRLLKDELASSIDIEIAGVGGNRLIELINRLDRDIVPFQPDTLVIFIGINDAFTHCGASQFFDPLTYHSLYDELLNRIADKLPKTRVILVTPAVLADPMKEALPSNTYLQCLIDSIGDYQDVVKQVGNDRNLEVIDYGQLTKELMQTHLPSELSSDGVHPNLVGAGFIKDLIKQKLLNKK